VTRWSMNSVEHEHASRTTDAMQIHILKDASSIIFAFMISRSSASLVATKRFLAVLQFYCSVDPRVQTRFHTACFVPTAHLDFAEKPLLT
jgi:hypothetical protein